jgi:hypothetical protein
MKTKRKINIWDSPMPIKAALQHRYASEFMAALRRKDMKIFEAYFVKLKQPFLKFITLMELLRADQFKNIFDPDIYAGCVKSDTLRVFFST